MQPSESHFDILAAFDEYEENTRAGFKHAPTKYCGNKLESLQNIYQHVPYLDTLCDVFGGSGQFLLSRRRVKHEIYNDRHSGMASFYRVLQNKDQFHQLIDRLELMQHSRECFYAFLNDLEQRDIDVVERAAKWYYVVQTSLGGMGRHWGRVKKPDTPIYDKIHAYVGDFKFFHDRLKGVQIENLDWEQCLKDYDSLETVFYMDPPYWESNQYAHAMSKADHRKMCERIFQCQGFVALSGYANNLYDQYPWDAVHEFEVSENFTPSEHSHKSRAEKRKEYLWIKEIEL